MAYRRRSSSWSRWPTRTTASEKAAVAKRQAKDVAKSGVKLQPVTIAGRTIASSFWGKSWCDAMESYGDYENRLPRGRTYVRNGSVTDLRVEPGIVRATVVGSAVYTTTITVQPLSPAVWCGVIERHAGQVSSLIDLLQGKLPTTLLQALGDRSSGLFPGPKELTFACSCPDWATMCKHVAAVLYGVGARLDTDPGLFFLLRGVDVAELTARGTSVSFAGAGEDELGGMDLGAMFGIEMAEGVTVAGAGSGGGTVTGKGTTSVGKAAASGKMATNAGKTPTIRDLASIAKAAIGTVPRGPRATGSRKGGGEGTTTTGPAGFAVPLVAETLTGTELAGLGVTPAMLEGLLLRKLLLLGARFGEYTVTPECRVLLRELSGTRGIGSS